MEDYAEVSTGLCTLTTAFKLPKNIVFTATPKTKQSEAKHWERCPCFRLACEEKLRWSADKLMS